MLLSFFATKASGRRAANAPLIAGLVVFGR